MTIPSRPTASSTIRAPGAAAGPTQAPRPQLSPSGGSPARSCPGTRPRRLALGRHVAEARRGSRRGCRGISAGRPSISTSRWRGARAPKTASSSAAAARPNESGEADDLALARPRGRLLDAAGDAECRAAAERLDRGCGVRARREVERPRARARSSARRGVAGRTRQIAPPPTPSPSRSTVTRSTQIEHLAHAVRDEGHGDPCSRSARTDGEQGRHLVVGERARRLVEDQDAGFHRQRARDLDHLLLVGPQPPDRSSGSIAESSARASRPRARACDPVDALPVPRLARDRGRCSRRPTGRGTSVVSWVTVAIPARIARRRRRTEPGSPSSTSRAAVRRSWPDDDLQQRRLARAVLAHQRVDLARAQLEVDAAQRVDAAVALVHAERAQRRGGAHCAPVPSARSIAAAAASTRSSRNGAPATCTPIGSPSSAPAGTLAAGRPPSASRCT